MQLLTNVDPRDNLQKATRWELIDYARANGVDVPADAPAIYTMKVLRSRGLTNIKIPDRPLGLYANGPETTAPQVESETEINTASADDDLIRQYEQEKKQPPVSEMSMTELRHACKVKGIKMDRTDNKQTLKDKLSGQQDAA